MTKQGTCETLCIHSCAYYRPGKNEEFACRGYLVIERLCAQGKPIDLTQNCSARDMAGTELLVKMLCSACDFRVDGCDFILDRKAVPCGGFLLLSQLLAQGTISQEDLE